MKIKKETALFQTPFGSHLYGTNTATSDYDYKVVCLPSHIDLLLGKQIRNRVEKPTSWVEGEKMAANEVEREFIPLHIFLDDFMSGQTYALEIAFCVLQDRHTALEYEYGGLSVAADSYHIQTWMNELVSRFLTRNVEKMVGYAVSQSRLYGLKTQRYTALKQVYDIINTSGQVYAPHVSGSTKHVKIGETPDLLNQLFELPHVEACEIMNANGGTEVAPGVSICEKKFPVTARWSTVLASLDDNISRYGTRVKEHEGKDADWKALSHAIRIIEQTIELCETGFIQFPRPNADFLLKVKQAGIPLDEALAYLTEKFNKIDNAVYESSLPERTAELDEQFAQFKLNLLCEYYGI